MSMNVSMNPSIGAAQNFKAQTPAAPEKSPEKKPVNKKKVAIGVGVAVGVTAATLAVIYGVKTSKFNGIKNKVAGIKDKIPSIKKTDGNLVAKHVNKNGEKVTTTFKKPAIFQTTGDTVETIVKKDGSIVETVFNEEKIINNLPKTVTKSTSNGTLKTSFENGAKKAEELTKKDGTIIETLFDKNGDRAAMSIKTRKGAHFTTCFDPITGKKMASNEISSKACSLTYYDKGKKIVSNDSNGLRVFGVDGKTVKNFYGNKGNTWYEARMSGKLPDDVKAVCDKVSDINRIYYMEYGIHGPLSMTSLCTSYV